VPDVIDSPADECGLKASGPPAWGTEYEFTVLIPLRKELVFHKIWRDLSVGGAVMSDNDLLDSVLLSLADEFETHRPNSAGIAIEPLPGEWEALRELLARQFADGLMLHTGTGKPSWFVKFTQKGYTTHRPRIEALRTLGRSKSA
jgi:hypothetical protein